MSREVNRPASPPSVRFPGVVGAIGGGLGAIVGLVELVLGPQIRGWVGDKQDTTRLGLATILLSLVALAAAAFLAERPAAPAPRRLAAAVGLLVPAAVCFTTAGRLWYVPGALLIAAGLLALLGLRGEVSEALGSLERHWLGMLTGGLAALYIVLGAVALGFAGALGILGGLLIVAALVAAARGAGRVGTALLVLGAVPFAVITWWSVVTPLMAVLVLVIGGLTMATDLRHEDRRSA